MLVELGVFHHEKHGNRGRNDEKICERKHDLLFCYVLPHPFCYHALMIYENRDLLCDFHVSPHPFCFHALIIE